MSINPLATSAIGRYVELFARLLTRIELETGPFGIEIGTKEEAEKSADDRLALLDAAKANFAQGIVATDELRGEAARNKREIEVAIRQIVMLQSDKLTLEQQRDEVKRLVATDVSTFRQVAGVPSPAPVRRERLIGFASGVVDSLAAAGIIWGGRAILNHLG
ncbi:MAG: hypothetical protein H3C62_06335 [Gemmatimonadaceae bacterium]|nr:hypothetical protein [Gemmatimonadaceae bacterium]